jgi:hypothetical protein
MHDVGIVYGRLVYLKAIWYIFPVLVCYTKKNLATQISTIVEVIFNSVLEFQPLSG